MAISESRRREIEARLVELAVPPIDERKFDIYLDSLSEEERIHGIFFLREYGDLQMKEKFRDWSR
jgi:hypothetical protein